jgi:excisionase family DNA binding protein
MNRSEMSQTRPLMVGQTAALLGVTKSTIYRWIDKGYVKAIRLPGGHFRIPLEEVERMMAPHTHHENNL